MIVRVVVIIMLLSRVAYSQSGIKILYFDKNGKKTDNKEGSFYYRKEKQELIDKDTIFSFYSSNDKVRSMKIVDRSGIGNGKFIYYFESGQVKSKGSFKNGFPSGIILSYYPNGKAQSIESYDPSTHKSILVNYYDSTGNSLIVNSSGYCDCYFNSYDFSSIKESGKLVDGLRDSVWTGYLIDGTKYFEETYSKGELIKGIHYDSLGGSFIYNLIETTAEPVGGMQAFYEHIARVLKYPTAARRANVQGKVFVEFVVNRDGVISEVKVIKGIGYGCEAKNGSSNNI